MRLIRILLLWASGFLRDRTEYGARSDTAGLTMGSCRNASRSLAVVVSKQPAEAIPTYLCMRNTRSAAIAAFWRSWFRAMVRRKDLPERIQ